MRQCEGNVTAAIEMLNREEVVMLEQFESAVKDMVRETVLLLPFLFPFYIDCFIFIFLYFLFVSIDQFYLLPFYQLLSSSELQLPFLLFYLHLSPLPPLPPNPPPHMH